MSDWVTEKEWQTQLLRGSPFLDVRAPVEFNEGTLSGSYNIPILNDDERHQVGLCYKESGPEAALKLGHRLVSGAVKEARISKWQDLVREHPDTILFCFRGGQRSGMTQNWLRENKIEIPRIEGGYKKVRQFLLNLMTELPPQMRLISLGGHTGSGKTRVLRAADPTRVLDLEKLANHRGSAFGPEISPQPAQAQFENQLALELWRAHTHRPDLHLWVEDEARTIGRISLNDNFFNAIRECPLVLIEESRSARARLILEEYVIEAFNLRHSLSPATAWEDLENTLNVPIHKISRKLGGARAKEAFALISEAMKTSRASMNFESHLAWIDFILEHYYDAFYERHMERQSHRIVFRGTRQECLNLIHGDDDLAKIASSHTLTPSPKR